MLALKKPKNKYFCASHGQCNVSVTAPSVTLSLHLKQGDDVALPEVPAEPVPEVPEAAKTEPGKVDFFFFSFF